METFQYTGILTHHQLAQGLTEEIDGELLSRCNVSPDGTIYYPDDTDIESAIASIEANPPTIATPPDWEEFTRAVSLSTPIRVWRNAIAASDPVLHADLMTAARARNAEFFLMLLAEAIAIQPLPQEAIALANQFNIPLE